jgi:hypothetical protein
MIRKATLLALALLATSVAPAAAAKHKAPSISAAKRVLRDEWHGGGPNVFIGYCRRHETADTTSCFVRVTWRGEIKAVHLETRLVGEYHYVLGWRGDRIVAWEAGQEARS